ncbi:T9SS type A sorting domain-containing protein [Polaribacter haliotis]|uniref:T9SS type A sorting domain-containing protein n=1 Tax=Polaribacter haliotis TaxID=1888915 RepID=A0A7L8AI99_9FLAO|nr:T9SS type A sorting domain-containing protein [Polaribacter haliotis]QOD61718.1 T9SS type A sorting domain-containing protein [Polaribacter haliotis]
MKKILFISITLFSTISLFSQNWEYVGDDRFSGAIYANIFNMTVTKDGKPIVYLKEDRQSNRAKARIFNGTDWIAYGPENGFGPGSESELNIETDNDNNVVVVYEAVRGYGKRYSDRWRDLGGGSGVFSSGRTNYMDLVVSKKSNNPYVVYADEPNRNRATVRKFNNTARAWEFVGNFAFTNNIVRFTTIAVDTNETPYIAFQDRSLSAKISVMKFDGTNWVYVGDGGFIDGEAQYTSIAINSKNEVYIFYSNKENGNKGIVKKFDGTNWVNVGSSEIVTSGSAIFNQIKFSKNDTPYIAFKDGANEGKTTVMRFSKNDWETVGKVGFSNGSANVLSLHFDDSGNLFLGFSEANNVDFRASVMKFDTTTLSINETKFKDDKLEVFPNPSSNFIEIKTSANIKEICIYNTLGQRKIKQKIRKIDVSELNSGVYILSVITSNGKKEIRKFIKN